MQRPLRGTGPLVWRRLLAGPRSVVRSLTSMRTALALLFLLTIASVPGALLPQRSLNVSAVDTYLAEHRTLGPWMDRLSVFDVFSAPWFTAIYGLLFVSLIGCLLPRTLEHARILRTGPVAAPRNLARLPHHGTLTSPLTPPEAAVAVRGRLRRWRTVQRVGDASGEVVLSSERGYSREVGNLVFHFSLIGLLVAVAVGKLVGYEGQIIVIADGGPGFCNTSPAGYDSFRSGLSGDGTGLDPFCVRVNNFTADYLPTGEAASFLATIDYQVGDDLTTNTWRPYPLRVNDPLRLAGDRVYLLGHGYAPRFTVTYPDGETRSETLQFRPEDNTTFLSDGTLRFDPPAGTYPDPDVRRHHEIAVTGLFAPTASFTGTVLTSRFPALTDPAVAIDVYQGDTGLDSGKPQSIFTLDPALTSSGRLVRQARVNLRPGGFTTLTDGTSVRFDSATPWVSLQTSHDPAQGAVLLFAITMTGGLMLSLLVKRRRVWVRITPTAGGGCAVELGGLARTDQAGWGEQFPTLVDSVRESIT